MYHKNTDSTEAVSFYTEIVICILCNFLGTDSHFYPKGQSVDLRFKKNVHDDIIMLCVFFVGFSWQSKQAASS